MKSKKNISIIVPIYNELEVLPDFLDRLLNTINKISKYNFDIILVNDGSEDDSCQYLINQKNKIDNITIIDLSRNFGKEAALTAGIDVSNGDALIPIDCDLQDPPELIEQMYKLITEEKLDIINTQRLSRQGESILKKFLTKSAYKIINLFNKDKILEDSGDFKMLSRKALNAILLFKDNDPFTRGFPVLVGLKQKVVQYNRDKRNFGKTHYSLLKSINPYKELLRGLLFNSFRPIYLIFVTGIIFFFTTVLCFIFFKIKLEIFLILFFFSIMQLSLGFLGLYMKKILDKIYQNPSAFIEYEEGFEKNDN